MANDNSIYDAEVKLVPESSVYLVNSSTLALYKSVSEHSNDNISPIRDSLALVLLVMSILDITINIAYKKRPPPPPLVLHLKLIT